MNDSIFSKISLYPVEETQMSLAEWNEIYGKHLSRILADLEAAQAESE